MASLQEIQEMVKKAEEAIREHNNDSVRRVYWPAIKDALNENNPPDRLVRSYMRVMIYQHLDEAGLHGAVPEPIDVEKLVNNLNLQLGGQEPEQPVGNWLPF